MEFQIQEGTQKTTYHLDMMVYIRHLLSCDSLGQHMSDDSFDSNLADDKRRSPLELDSMNLSLWASMSMSSTQDNLD